MKLPKKIELPAAVNLLRDGNVLRLPVVGQPHVVAPDGAKVANCGYDAYVFASTKPPLYDDGFVMVKEGLRGDKGRRYHEAVWVVGRPHVGATNGAKVQEPFKNSSS